MAKLDLEASEASVVHQHWRGDLLMLFCVTIVLQTYSRSAAIDRLTAQRCISLVASAWP